MARPFISNNVDGVHGTSRPTSITTDAGFCIDMMLFMRCELDSLGGAHLGAKGTPDALVVDHIVDQVGALAGRAPPFEVSFILLPEIPEGTQHRIGSGFPESAKASFPGPMGQPFQFVEVFLLSSTAGETLQDV